MKTRENSIPAELAPCGIFCGACPSFAKSCMGCASEDKTQKRKSKWSCKIRMCSYETKSVEFCFECDEFPCEKLRKKLFNSHKGDPKFKYRHEVLDNLAKLSEEGIDDYLDYQYRKWTCASCEGRVYWYQYKCSQCGKGY